MDEKQSESLKEAAKQAFNQTWDYLDMTKMSPEQNDDMLAERSPDRGIGRPEEDDAPCSAECSAMAYTGIISQVDPRSRKLFAQHIERLRTYNPYPSGYRISKAPFDFGRPQDKRDFTTP